MKGLKVLVCAVVLAVAGFNAYTVMNDHGDEVELRIDNLEAMADDEHGWIWHLFHKQHKELRLDHVSSIQVGKCIKKTEYYNCVIVDGKGADQCLSDEYRDAWLSPDGSWSHPGIMPCDCY